jgi:hypothetical protein
MVAQIYKWVVQIVYNTFLGDQPPEDGITIECNIFNNVSVSIIRDWCDVTAKWLFLSKKYAIGGAQCPVPVQTTGKIVGAVMQSEVSCLGNHCWKNWMHYGMQSLQPMMLTIDTTTY